MPKPIIKVGVNGIGTIGKRVTDAVALQKDMKIVGIADITPDYKVRLAAEKGYPVYASLPERMAEMERGGIEIAGILEDLLKEVDVIVDCTPAGIGAKNKSAYEKAGVKAIFEGGESASVAQSSFVAQCNYGEALGKQFIRVVSCNTTGLCRSLGALHKKYGLKRARAVLVRRAADPWESKKGPINAIIPETRIPSHHGPDVQTVLHDLNITTLACEVPTTLSHVHFVSVEPKVPITVDDVINTFNEAPRILLFRSDEGFKGTQAVIEYMRDLGRPRYDMWELAVFEDSISAIESEIYWIMQVHQEAIVIPENVDAIRAAMEIETDPMKSIAKTNESLGLLK